MMILPEQIWTVLRKLIRMHALRKWQSVCYGMHADMLRLPGRHSIYLQLESSPTRALQKCRSDSILKTPYRSLL